MSLMARSLTISSVLQTNQDHAAEISSESSSSGITGQDEWKLAIVFSLDGRQVQMDAPWDDADQLWAEIARHFAIPVDNVHRAIHVAARPLDLEQDDLECLLLQQRGDVPSADFLRLTLTDIEYQADHHAPAMRLQRKPRWIPRRITRDSLIRLLGFDGHCSPDPNRCDVWINNVYKGSDAGILDITNGNYIRLAVPSHPDEPPPTVCGPTAVAVEQKTHPWVRMMVMI